MDTLRIAALLGATLTMGLVAGTFALYAHTVMPGLKRTDDRTFVGAFQALDRAIINAWFMGSAFGGALVLTVAAALVNGGDRRAWILAALALYLVTVVITVAVNVPRNDAIKAAGEPDAIDAGAVRAAFGEARWAAWNLVRVATSTTAFACLAWALVLYGRATA